MNSSTNTKIIDASIGKVYEAFINPMALEYWLAPNGMTGKVHDFKPGVNGGYTMSLFYKDEQIEGKTAGNEDRFTARFDELRPFERIVQTIQFDSNEQAFQEEMIMETTLKELQPGRTEVTIVFKNIPAGINPKDNEAGTDESLNKLRRYLDANPG